MATAQVTQIVKSNVAQIDQLLRESQERISTVIQQHIKADRMIAVALELVTGDSKLSLCEPVSVLKGVMEASQLGLSLNKHLGQAYLIAYRNGELTRKNGGIQMYTAEFQIGYRGFLDMVTRSNPNVTSIYSRIVYSGEHFELLEGTQHQLVHVPSLSRRKLEEMIGAYAVVLFKDGSPADFEWMPKEEIEKVHRFSKAQGEDSPWATWPEEMVKKTPLRRLCKRLKLTPDVIEATVRDEYRELGYEGEQQKGRPVMMPSRVTDATNASSSEGQEPDADNEQHPQQQEGDEVPKDKLTVAEREEIFKLAKTVGFPSKEAVNELLLQKFGVKDTKDITTEQYPQVLKVITEWKNSPAEKADDSTSKPEASKQPEATKGKGKKKSPESAAPAETKKLATIEDEEQRKVLYLARTYLWMRAQGNPDDAFHTFLRNQVKVETVAEIPEVALAAVKMTLKNGPEAIGLQVAK
ncbi:MAG TPA: recombinase RecT [Terriglobia bacterium]|nr:recombinase RecT [Terriglobia bacterium]